MDLQEDVDRGVGADAERERADPAPRPFEGKREQDEAGERRPEVGDVDEARGPRPEDRQRARRARHHDVGRRRLACGVQGGEHECADEGRTKRAEAPRATVGQPPPEERLLEQREGQGREPELPRAVAGLLGAVPAVPPDLSGREVEHGEGEQQRRHRRDAEAHEAGRAARGAAQAPDIVRHVAPRTHDDEHRGDDEPEREVAEDLREVRAIDDLREERVERAREEHRGDERAEHRGREHGRRLAAARGRGGRGGRRRHEGHPTRPDPARRTRRTRPLARHTDRRFQVFRENHAAIRMPRSAAVAAITNQIA